VGVLCSKKVNKMSLVLRILIAVLFIIVSVAIPIYCCILPMKVKCPECGRWNKVKDNGWNSWECECGNYGKIRMDW